MFRPQIQKTTTLFFIAIFNIFMVYLAVNSKVKIERSGFKEKIIATEKMENMLKQIRKDFPNMTEEDIYESGILGINNSLITSIDDPDTTMLASKQITTHPNFAALAIELLNEAEISQGDTIAVSMTGSFPGANIALHSACLAMDVTPIIITSIASSSWGANIETFSWPIMEEYLFDKKLIKSKSIAYSIGGKDDIGGQIDSLGIDIIVSIAHDAVNKGVIFINEPTLQKNVLKKINLFEQKSDNYSAYVNIGGGAASMGAGIVKDTMRVGLITALDLEYMDLGPFEESIAYNFIGPIEGSKQIPIINIKSIKTLTKDLFDIENNNIKIYKGNLFYRYYRYNPFVILVALFLTLSLIIAVGLYSHFQIKKRMESNEIDSII